MAPPANVVLRGPKQPTWECRSCHADGNWQSRIACRSCGEAPPAKQVQAAKRAAAAEALKPAQKRPDGKGGSKGGGKAAGGGQGANAELSQLKAQVRELVAQAAKKEAEDKEPQQQIRIVEQFVAERQEAAIPEQADLLGKFAALAASERARQQKPPRWGALRQKSEQATKRVATAARKLEELQEQANKLELQMDLQREEVQAAEEAQEKAEIDLQQFHREGLRPSGQRSEWIAALGKLNLRNVPAAEFQALCSLGRYLGTDEAAREEESMSVDEDSEKEEESDEPANLTLSEIWEGRLDDETSFWATAASAQASTAGSKKLAAVVRGSKKAAAKATPVAAAATQGQAKAAVGQPVEAASTTPAPASAPSPFTNPTGGGGVQSAAQPPAAGVGAPPSAGRCTVTEYGTAAAATGPAAWPLPPPQPFAASPSAFPPLQSPAEVRQASAPARARGRPRVVLVEASQETAEAASGSGGPDAGTDPRGRSRSPKKVDGQDL
jgi:hypothetical protein